MRGRRSITLFCTPGLLLRCRGGTEFAFGIDFGLDPRSVEHAGGSSPGAHVGRSGAGAHVGLLGLGCGELRPVFGVAAFGGGFSVVLCGLSFDSSLYEFDLLRGGLACGCGG